ncbi:hypothetical protein [Methanomethylovorans sp.]|uniref:hypothetical protein n=1 Tax=Methanomethylovorans sp. TaxID=2758717 RepID=UPI00345E4C40
MKSTVIATTKAGKLLHVTHDDNAFSQIAVGEGETTTITTKIRTDTGYYRETSGTVTLRKL